MTTPQRNSAGRGLSALRQLANKVVVGGDESCDLCSVGIGPEHDHLLNPATRELRCACRACAILFSSTGETTYRRVPRDIWNLAEFTLDDGTWAALGIPIGLAFISRSGINGGALAVYPSPAGPVQTVLDREIWEDLAIGNFGLEGMMPDVEALLINRVNGAREYFIVPIDECYKLTGIVRMHWRGFSGGDAAWERIHVFFDNLKSRSVAPGNRFHAGSIV